MTSDRVRVRRGALVHLRVLRAWAGPRCLLVEVSLRAICCRRGSLFGLFQSFEHAQPGEAAHRGPADGHLSSVQGPSASRNVQHAIFWCV